MGSIKVNITCGGERMEVQQLKIEPQSWHHRFEISVNSEMLNGKNIISIEMKEVIPTELNTNDPQELRKEPLNAARAIPQIIQSPKTPKTPQTALLPKVKEEILEQEKNETIDGSVWL